MSSWDRSSRKPHARTVWQRLRRYADEVWTVLSRSGRHQDRLANVEHRVSISGTRGKSTMCRWLHDELVNRDFDTYAKITGDTPLSLYNGLEWVIPRHGGVKLYENERQIRRFSPMDVLVVENQGITPYTTRLVNSRFVDPTIVVVTNIREDHLDTLGENRLEIARSFARSIPKHSHVLCGEADDVLRRYFAAELQRRNSSVRYVDVPAEFAHAPGAEIVFLLDELLREIDGRGLDDHRAEDYLESFRVRWTHLTEGRVFNAASMNDVQSTEAVRRSLVDDPDEVITPLVYLRRDRPGRTASFARYLQRLADDGLIDTAHVVDGHGRAFDRATTFAVETHDRDVEPESVLFDALADGHPVVLMGNATPEFMQRLDEILTRESTVAEPHSERDGLPVDEVVEPGEQVLLLETPHRHVSDEICIDLLSWDRTARSCFIGTEQIPHEQLERWEKHAPAAADRPPTILTATAETESMGLESEPAPTTLPGLDVPIHEFDDVAEAVSEVVSFTMDTTNEAPAAVCFDSVSRLIEERSLEDAFRFLFTASDALRTAGVTAHYHFSTAGHDDTDVRTIAQIFDRVVTINEDGEDRMNDLLDTHQPPVVQ